MGKTVSTLFAIYRERNSLWRGLKSFHTVKGEEGRGGLERKLPVPPEILTVIVGARAPSTGLLVEFTVQALPSRILVWISKCYINCMIPLCAI